ncbi:protein FAR1-RELATED SEQUENCE 5-like [Apium graveolens]|uniref:protein FAR1-RELATED SEQUENCE 5-like n=1 Tax=Apium graveolens TaxID=4045 RepID=UPI003D7B1CE1
MPLDFGKGKRVREVIPRTNCGARMCVIHKVKMDKWQISSVDLEHNHKLVSPEKVQFFQRSLNIDPMTRSLIELFNKSGIETSKVMKFLSETKGGVEILVFLIKTYVMSYVIFGAEYDENRVRGLVWVDPRSMNVYKNFGDVVTDETKASYKWVLRTWLEAVDNKPPRTIITDQDIALGNAIAEVMPMPQTNHTYCTWHISSRWEQLVEKYDLEDHAWLNDMYALRTQWIGAYTKQHFSAGMTTTSRSESTIFCFDEYVQSSTGLKEFIENSQKALETQYLKEVKADYDSEQLERRLVLHSSLEMHASEIYTKEMFKHFQKELMKSTCYIVNSVKNNGTYMSKLYLVEKATLPENYRRKYRVTVFMYEKIECSCKKFEHSGMICKHIIRYLDKK